MKGRNGNGNTPTKTSKKKTSNGIQVVPKLLQKLALGYTGQVPSVSLGSCQAAIKALSSCVINSKMIWECRNKLNEVGKKIRFFLIWVLGHSEIKRNEEAYTLAKEGARMSLIGLKPLCCIDKCTYKKEFLEKEKAKKEKFYRNLPLSSYGTLQQQDPKDIWILVRNNYTPSLGFYRTLSPPEAPVEDGIIGH